jgi:hypothetical protein
LETNRMEKDLKRVLGAAELVTVGNRFSIIELASFAFGTCDYA